MSEQSVLYLSGIVSTLIVSCVGMFINYKISKGARLRELTTEKKYEAAEAILKTILEVDFIKYVHRGKERKSYFIILERCDLFTEWLSKFNLWAVKAHLLDDKSRSCCLNLHNYLFELIERNPDYYEHRRDDCNFLTEDELVDETPKLDGHFTRTKNALSDYLSKGI